MRALSWARWEDTHPEGDSEDGRDSEQGRDDTAVQSAVYNYVNETDKERIEERTL